MAQNTLILTIASMVKHPEEVVKKVLETKEGLNKPSYSRIAQKVSKELSYDLDAEDVKEIVQKTKELLKSGKLELQELNEAIQDDKKYDFIDDHYIIYTQVNSKE